MSDLRLGRVIQVLRQAQDISQLEAAKRAKDQGYTRRMDADAMSKIEREDREPTFEDGRLILRALGVEVRFETEDGIDLDEILGELE